MVLLVTGKCSYKCYYCPLSLKKQGKDDTYANEKLVQDDDDIIFEAESIEARGTGITGGDPLLAMKKTVSELHEPVTKLRADQIDIVLPLQERAFQLP